MRIWVDTRFPFRLFLSYLTPFCFANRLVIVQMVTTRNGGEAPNFEAMINTDLAMHSLTFPLNSGPRLSTIFVTVQGRLVVMVVVVVHLPQFLVGSRNSTS